LPTPNNPEPRLFKVEKYGKLTVYHYFINEPDPEKIRQAQLDDFTMYVRQKQAEKLALAKEGKWEVTNL